MAGRFNFGTVELSKSTKGTLIALGGAVAAYALDQIVQLAGTGSLGTWSPLIAAGAASLINVVRQWVKENTEAK